MLITYHLKPNGAWGHKTTHTTDHVAGLRNPPKIKKVNQPHHTHFNGVGRMHDEAKRRATKKDRK